jgi:L-fucose isomerase-like protein
MSARFGYVPVSSSMSGDGAGSDIIGRYATSLEALGGERWELGKIAEPVPLAVFVVTGGTERTILDVWRRRYETTGRTPALIVAHRGDNSLPAALEALARMRQDGRAGRIVYLEGPEDTTGLDRLSESIKDEETRAALKRARIGAVGSPSGWLVASSPDPSVVRSKWGPHVVPVSLDQLLDAMRSPEGLPSSRGESLVSSAREVVEPSPEDVEVATRVTSAVMKLVEANKLTAVALRCFDLVEELGATGCVALAELADRGLAAGCEGDIVSTVSMLWLRELVGEVPWMANPSAVETDSNLLVLAHCTIPKGMVEGYVLRSHFESGRGVALEGSLPEGPVTLVRIGGREMDELWTAEGSIEEAEPCGDMCRTQASVRLARDGAAAELLERPLGNHVVLVRGHREERVTSWWRLMIAE